MDKITLEWEIAELIERHAEGEYWDFKQQWYLHNADLLHDIICMANSPANRDCYIIIGIEDKTFKILGVDTENRKNQQNVIELLRQKPKWAGGHIPEVYVRTIQIEGKEIDTIIIKQSNHTPFYLLEDYIKEGAPIFKGAIYTRKTPIHQKHPQLIYMIQKFYGSVALDFYIILLNGQSFTWRIWKIGSWLMEKRIGLALIDLSFSTNRIPIIQSTF